ncbi:hypothetical protein J6590_023487 [Homalodisca vitripennis]|nr:hypothetical protein J6590_023487 [Homalodisca vitripennis]
MSTQFFWLGAAFVAVPLIVYNLNQEIGSADHRGINSLTVPTVTNTTGPRAVPTLQFVIVVTRHGSRGPLFTYPTSPYKSNDKGIWPYGEAELTQLGRLQMHRLGKRIRSMYNGFLDPIYRPEDFLALSTPKPRSLQSAQVFLAGLFSPSGFQVWNEHLLWQPVPILLNYLDHYEIVPPPVTKCQRYYEEKMKLLSTFEREFESDLTELFNYAIPYTGFDNLDMKTTNSTHINFVLYSIWESLHIPKEEGLPLPAWSKKVYPQPVTSLIVKYTQAAAVGSETQIRYLQGELFKAMAGLMLSKTAGTLRPNRRMYYYSGHDFTVLGLQAILGLRRERLGLVKTGSALIYELHRDPMTGRFYIQVLYMDGTSPDLWPKSINIPGCDSPCDLHLLLNITEKYYNISDWERECQIVETS